MNTIISYIVEYGGELHLIPSLSGSFPLGIAMLRCPYSTKMMLAGSVDLPICAKSAFLHMITSL